MPRADALSGADVGQLHTEDGVGVSRFGDARATPWDSGDFSEHHGRPEPWRVTRKECGWVG